MGNIGRFGPEMPEEVKINIYYLLAAVDEVVIVKYNWYFPFIK